VSAAGGARGTDAGEARRFAVADSGMRRNDNLESNDFFQNLSQNTLNVDAKNSCDKSAFISSSICVHLRFGCFLR